MSLITRVCGNMWAHMMGKSVCLSLCPTGESRLWFGGRCRWKATVLRCLVIHTHLEMKFVVSTSMFCYNFLADTLLTTWAACVPCTTVCALDVIRQNFAQFKTIQRRHRCVWITIDDGVTSAQLAKRLGEINKSSPPPFIYQGPTNAMHVFVQRATCVKHMNR